MNYFENEIMRRVKELDCSAVYREQNDFVNITLHNFLKKNEFFGSPPKFTKRSGVSFGGDPVA